jgi:hypothetical protein
VEKAILKTLAYADIFDYPLTLREVHKFLIFNRLSEFKFVQATLFRMSAAKKRIRTDRTGRFYFLSGRKALIDLRNKRERFSQKKLRIARRTASLLKFIPTIKLVGVTGRLAMKNSDDDDDIDLLIISSKGNLWLTRFLVTILLELTGRRRRPEEKRAKDKVCLNMFLSEEGLAVPKNERDLYSAHEVVQMKPLWEKDNTYQKFLKANQWARKYLPDAIPVGMSNLKSQISNRRKIFTFYFLLFTFEHLAKRVQLWYMQRRRTTEVVTDAYVRFHPRSARDWVLLAYQRRLQKLGL